MRFRKYRRPGERPALRGGPALAFTLIECLVYVTLLFLILGLAYMAFYRTLQNNLNLTRNADDILRTLRAGEQWRDDIRHATGVLRLTGTGEQEQLVIPRKDVLVKYSFREGGVWREAGRAPAEILPGVAASSMQKETRQHVTAWRWEVELKAKQKVARVKPLFTFIAPAPAQTP